MPDLAPGSEVPALLGRRGEPVIGRTAVDQVLEAGLFPLRERQNVLAGRESEDCRHEGENDDRGAEPVEGHAVRPEGGVLVVLGENAERDQSRE